MYTGLRNLTCFTTNCFLTHYPRLCNTMTRGWPEDHQRPSSLYPRSYRWSLHFEMVKKKSKTLIFCDPGKWYESQMSESTTLSFSGAQSPPIAYRLFMAELSSFDTKTAWPTKPRIFTIQPLWTSLLIPGLDLGGMKMMQTLQNSAPLGFQGCP